MTTKPTTFRERWAHLRPDIWATLTLSAPIVIGQIGIILMGVADTMMVGQIGGELGKASLAASQVANAVFFTVAVIGIGVMMMISALTASAEAQQDYSLTARLLASGLQIGLGLGLVMMIIVGWIAYNFHWLQQPQEIESLAVSYFLIIGGSSLPLYWFLGLKNFADGLSMTKVAMYTTFLGLLLNVVLNYLFIHGAGFVPAMGLDGAGYATALTRLAMALGMFVYISQTSAFRQYLPNFSLWHVDKALVQKILSLGIPAGMQSFFEIAAFSAAAVMMGWLGTSQSAAHGIAINLASLTYMAAAGIGTGTSIRVGNAFGEGNVQHIRTAGSIGLGLVIVFMSVCCLIFVIFAPSLVSLYIEPSEVATIASSLVMIAGLFQLSDGVQVTALAILRGMEDVNVPTAIAMVAYWGIGLPLSYIFGFWFNWDAQGIWLALSLALTFSAVCLTLRFYFLANKHRRSAVAQA